MMLIAAPGAKDTRTWRLSGTAIGMTAVSSAFLVAL
jgi:hypothetical protein